MPERNRLQKGIEVFVGDPVGDGFLFLAALLAVGGIEPLAVGALATGAYHLGAVYKISRRFEEMIMRRGHHDIEQMRTLSNPIHKKNILARYTGYLWERAKKHQLGKISSPEASKIAQER